METNTNVAECGKSVKGEYHPRHLKYHSKIGEFECITCSKKFHQKSHLTRHMRIHSGEKPFLCSVCGKAYARNEQLRIHNREHTQELFQCSNCPKKFKTKQNLRCHLITHTGVSNFMCSFCKFAASSALALNQHLVTHTKEAAFHCNKCPKSFGTKSRLAVHTKRHLKSANKFQCAFCDYQIHIRHEMDDHIRRHIREKTFQCPQCPHATVTRTGLQHHFKQHEVGRKKFDCDICSKQLTSNCSFVYYKRLHSGHMEQCQFSQKRFTNVYKRNHHVKTQHPTATDNGQQLCGETRELRIYLTRIDE